jgi:hypothetical protein
MVPLSSAAVLEVLSGRGEALVGDEERSSIAPGSFIPVSHDVRLRITGNEEPLLVRVYLLRAE